jgi:hypothetical protein
MFNSRFSFSGLALLSLHLGCDETDKAVDSDSGVMGDADTDADADADADTDTDTDTDVAGLPVAVDDDAQVWEGEQVRIPAGANDLPGDNDLDMAALVVIDAPANGTAVSNPDGSIDYVHDGTETTADSFTYTIGDVAGLTSSPAMVTLNVGPVNDPPVALDDLGAVVTEDQIVTLDLAVNDSDADDGIDLGGIVVQARPLYGTVVVNGDGTVDYWHDGSEVPSDSFMYTITDLAGAPSNAANVEISIIGVNDAPIANDDVGTTEEGQQINIDVAANDIDSDDGLDLTSVAIVVGPVHGGVLVLADGSVNYTHDGVGGLDDSFTYTIDDLSGVTSNAATVMLSNVPPTAVDDAGLLTDGGLSSVDVASNDVDPDGVGLDLSSLVIVTPPVHGTAMPLADGTVDYQHDGLGVLEDTFSYTIEDLSGLTSNVAVVILQDGPLPCDQHPQWMPVTCTTPDWVWSRDRVNALTVRDAEALQVLATGCNHAGGAQPDDGNGLCSLTGGGWVSTVMFPMTDCDTDWYHLGGAFSGNCGGHDTSPPADNYRHLVMDINGCYNY